MRADVEPGFSCYDKFFDCAKSNCVEKSGTLRALCQCDWRSTGRLVAREHNQDAASSSHVWQKDAILDETSRRLVTGEKNQELLNFHENLKSTTKLVASGYSDSEGTGKIWPPICSMSSIFLLCQLLSNHVEKNATRNRRRKNCGQVEADAEPGFASRSKLFNSAAEFERIKQSGDTQKHPVKV